MIKKAAGLILIFFTVVCGASGLSASPDGMSKSGMADETTISQPLRTIIDDMKKKHDARPKGVPRSYEWSRGPKVHHLDQTSPDLLKRFHAIVAWGQAYVAAQGNPAKNVRVEVRNIKAYVLTKNDKKWRLAQAYPEVIGAAYREDFLMNISKPIDIRQEPDGGVSVKLIPGYNFHFFAPKRAPFDPMNTLGIYTNFQARLIVDDPKLPDDRNEARILANAGCDVWESLSNSMRGHAQPAVGVGRFKYLTGKWQYFNMISLTEEQTKKYRPPAQPLLQ